MERTAEVFADLYEQPLSEATVVQANTHVAEPIAPATAAVKEQLTRAEVAHLDESGLRADGKLGGVHVASTETLTHYEVQHKCGSEALDAIGILPDFKGTAVHDDLPSYFQYTEATQGLCNSHPRRALPFITEQYQQEWASGMTTLLLDIKQAVEEAQQQKPSHLAVEMLQAFERHYDALVAQGLEANPAPVVTEPQTKRRGRVKQSPPQNLLDRLKTHKRAVPSYAVRFADISRPRGRMDSARLSRGNRL